VVKSRWWALLAAATTCALVGLATTLASLMQVVDLYSQGRVFKNVLGSPVEGVVTTSPVHFLWSEFVIPLNQGPIQAAIAHPVLPYGVVLLLAGAATLVAGAVVLIRGTQAASLGDCQAMGSGDA
jgi:hypothetical protein